MDDEAGQDSGARSRHGDAASTRGWRSPHWPPIARCW